MESDFEGSTVLVSLHSPPNAQIRGIVASISAGQLLLRDVFWLASNHRTASFAIPSANIADLEVVAGDVAPEIQQPQQTPATHHIPRLSISPQQFDSNNSLPTSLRGSFSQQNDPLPSTVEAPTTQPTPVTSTFDDPAIVSFNKPNTKPSPNISKPLSPKADPPPIPRQMLAEAIRASPSRATPTIPPAHNSSLYRSAAVATATLHEPFDDLSIGRSHEEESEAAELGTDGGMENGRTGLGVQSGRRSRKKGKASHTTSGNAGSLPTHNEELELSPVSIKKQSFSGRARGSKAGEPAVAEGNGLSKSKKKRTTRRDRAAPRIKAPSTSGWATEDATDIQELGDFDFAGNLSKFDKREIFKQLKQDDNISAEDRLVGHNRLPKPGTAGGKNLHWTENVLEAPHVLSNAVATNNIYDSLDSDSHSDAVVSSERGSRRAGSRVGRFRPISRKGSGRGTAVEPHLAAATAAIPTIRSPNFTAPSPKTRAPLTSPFGTRSSVIIRLADSAKQVPTLSPLQMLEFEQFATTELGLSEDALTENAARGIARASLKAYRAASPGNGLAKPAVLVAVGNHRGGARVLAAARQLRNHGFSVTATIMGDGSAMLDSVRSAAGTLTKAGGRIVSTESLLNALKGEGGKASEGGLLIETLLGVHRRFEDLRAEDQAWYFECLGSVRRGVWRVCSVDCPSGVDAVTGELTQTDPPSAYPLTFPSTAVISLCAPKPYLALTTPTSSEPLQFVVDIGIGNLAWKRLGSRRAKGIDWGDDWIKELAVVNSE